MLTITTSLIFHVPLKEKDPRNTCSRDFFSVISWGQVNKLTFISFQGITKAKQAIQVYNDDIS